MTSTTREDEPLPFSIDGGGARPFDVEDPFNPPNRLEGYLCTISDHRYGMLYIQRVNGEPAEQLIWSTPKMRYPFNNRFRFRFTSGIERVEVYEKLDGTNILMYGYHDAAGNEFVTYKTRRTPTLVTGGATSFFGRWQEILAQHPDLTTLREQNGMNIAFELCGYRNQVLVTYEYPLRAYVLFGRRETGEVVPPSGLDCGTVPPAPLLATIERTGGDEHWKTEYQAVVNDLNARLTVTEDREGDPVYHGLEGTVWYAVSDTVTLYKCKPDSIRDIQESDGIARHSVWTTCVNAFEERDEIDFEIIAELLEEEFDAEDVQRNRKMIEDVIEHANLQIRFRRLVIEEYLARQKMDPTFDLNRDKGTVMRHFGGWLAENGYERRLASRVYTELDKEFGRGAKGATTGGRQ